MGVGGRDSVAYLSRLNGVARLQLVKMNEAEQGVWAGLRDRGIPRAELNMLLKTGRLIKTGSLSAIPISP